MTDFWTRLDSLLAEHKLVIDQPKGSAHHRFPELIYPIDYGYLEGTTGGDGDGIDVWRGSLPDAGLVAVCCTVDMRKRDAEVKLLIGCTEAEIDVIYDFHNGEHSMSGIIVRREKRA